MISEYLSLATHDMCKVCVKEKWWGQLCDHDATGSQTAIDFFVEIVRE